MYKDEEYFSSYESYVNFVKGCEKAVRTNDRYKKYINYLKIKYHLIIFKIYGKVVLGHI